MALVAGWASRSRSSLEIPPGDFEEDPLELVAFGFDAHDADPARNQMAHDFRYEALVAHIVYGELATRTGFDAEYAAAALYQWHDQPRVTDHAQAQAAPRSRRHGHTAGSLGHARNRRGERVRWIALRSRLKRHLGR